MSDVFDAWRERRFARLRRLIDRGLPASASVAVKRRRRPRLAPKAPPRRRPVLSMRMPVFVASEPLDERRVEVSIGDRSFTPPEWRDNPEAYVE